MNRNVLLVVGLAAATVLVGAPESADANKKSCLCSVSFVVRPCGGTLTKPAGTSAKKRLACRKAGTDIIVKKRTEKVGTTNQCEQACRRFGRSTIAKVKEGPHCARRRGNRIISLWRAYFGGKKPLDDLERKALCPTK